MASLRLPFLRGAAAQLSLVDSVTQVLAKTAPKVELVPLCVKSDAAGAREALKTKGSAVFGAMLSSDEIATLGSFHCSLTHTSDAVIQAINPEYKGVQICLVRTLVSDPEPCALRYRDRIDSLNGFNLEKETAHARQCMERAVRSAIVEAKIHKADNITLVLKPVSRHEKMNALMSEVTQAVCADAGMTFTSVNTSQLHNRLVMFPEQLGVVLANDVPASDLLEGLVLGVAGGRGVTHQQLIGEGVKGFIGGSNENPASTIMAAISAMQHLGFQQEAENTLKVLRNVVAKSANRTKDMGGALNAHEFAQACTA